MNWATQRGRIRRFLRDPDGDIWSDAFLLRLYNDEQYLISNETGKLQDVKVVRLPPKFQSGYMHDWEWPHNDNGNGEVFRVGYFYDADEKVFMHKWESEHMAGYTPSTSAAGSNYTQPWEAWNAATPAEPPPVHLPSKFHKLLYLAWDRKPVDPISRKEVEDRDMSWRTRQGNPLFYYRDQEESDLIYLYPIPSSVTAQDSSEGEGDPDTAQYGSTTVDVDNNLLAVFETAPTELVADDDESDLPVYLKKFLEYGVIGRGYGANTDGRIESLAEYWNMRRAVAVKMIHVFKSRKRVDREYCLQTEPGADRIRSRRHPRLPDEYPAVYP
jgi:hypothetical protein